MPNDDIEEIDAAFCCFSPCVRPGVSRRRYSGTGQRGRPIVIAEDRRLLELFASRVRRLVPKAAIWAFGSRARGNPDPDSDLDLFTALITRARFRARLAAERSLLIESFIIYTLQAR